MDSGTGSQQLVLVAYSGSYYCYFGLLASRSSYKYHYFGLGRGRYVLPPSILTLAKQNVGVRAFKKQQERQEVQRNKKHDGVAPHFLAVAPPSY